MKRQITAEVGRFCQSRAGRDKNTIYIIIKIENDFVFVADGEYKKVEKPKKKRIKHIKLMDNVCEAVAKNLEEGRTVHDSQISSAINKSKEASKNG